MNRISAFFLATLFTGSAYAAPPTDVAALKSYATKALPLCSDEKLTLDRLDQLGPTGFMTFSLTLESSDTTCGRHTNLLYSPSTQQILIGSVIPLAPDNRPADVRVAERSSELLKEPMTASLSRTFPLPDGLK